jgi:hypothetical protein
MKRIVAMALLISETLVGMYGTEVQNKVSVSE